MAFKDGFKTFPVLTTARLRLRQLISADADAYHPLLETVAPSIWGLRGQDVDETRSQLAGREKGFTNKATIAWAICSEGRLIGEIKLFGFAHQSKGEIAYWLAVDHRRQGYGMEALQAVTDFGLSVLRLHRIEAFAQPTNTASVALLMRARYKAEGLLRQWRREGDTWHDFAAFARLRDD